MHRCVVFCAFFHVSESVRTGSKHTGALGSLWAACNRFYTGGEVSRTAVKTLPHETPWRYRETVSIFVYLVFHVNCTHPTQMSGHPLLIVYTVDCSTFVLQRLTIFSLFSRFAANGFVSKVASLPDLATVWLLTTRYWLLAIDYWLLAIGC